MKLTLAVGVLLAACSSGAPRTSVPTSVCAINSDRAAHVGKVVTVAATYKTDSAHFEYLLDPSCGTGGILGIGLKDGSRARSVEDFYAASEELCKRRDAVFLCNIHGEIVAEGTIVPGDDGRLKFNLLSVSSYRFADER